MKDHARPGCKKPYDPPKLLHYGQLTEVTQGIPKGMANFDSGGGSSHKTGV